MAAAYKIKTTICPLPERHIIKWSLDSPTNNLSVSYKNLTNDEVNFRGWILPKQYSDITPVLRCGNEQVFINLEFSRPDVIRKVLNDEPSGHPQRKCGFNVNLSLPEASFSFGFLIEDEFIPLLHGQIEGMFRVIEGNGKWLFLDNDTNHSVEQFTGKLLLTWKARRAWKRYFNHTLALSKETNTPVCMLLAPSKEMIYPQHYPYKQARKTPMTQLLKLVPEEFQLIFPDSELKNMGHRSYRFCDTHWTLHGARLASILLVNKLTGSSFKNADLFSHDQYESRTSYGDLGNKIYPRKGSREDVLSNFGYNTLVQFDNKLPNFGRIIVFSCPEPKLNKTLLLFGSSSAYSMFHYISRIFKSVIFIHTAGNIDPAVIQRVSPDYICLQSNARFIVRVPKIGESLSNYIDRKRNQVPKEQLKAPIIAENIPTELRELVSFFCNL